MMMTTITLSIFENVRNEKTGEPSTRRTICVKENKELQRTVHVSAANSLF